MRLSDIKPHLRSYSIVQRRKTTINHAFASALAPCDEYDEARLAQAMDLLGQVDLNDLRCVYCGSSAETWDHLVGLVKNSELSGYGHQVGNLVPCCRHCNSLKGNRDWRDFLRTVIADPVELGRVEQRLTRYLKQFTQEVDVRRSQEAFPAEWQRYNAIKRQIIELMAEADSLAVRLRLHVTVSSDEHRRQC